jgi:SHS2 domain-containing protein
LFTILRDRVLQSQSAAKAVPEIELELIILIPIVLLLDSYLANQKHGRRTCWGSGMSITNHWEHFPHEADVGVRGVGETLAQAYEQAALALTAAITDIAAVVPQAMIQIACDAPDIELLLVDWLNALVYEMATRSMLFSRFEVQLQDKHLTARVWGEAIDVARHHPATEVKGATYTALKVAQQPDGGWLAQCVVDV